MMWILFILIAASVLGGISLPFVLVVLGVRFVMKRLGGRKSKELPSRSERPTVSLPSGSRKGCPKTERAILKSMEKRLETARQRGAEAMDRRIMSEMARSRVAPPLQEAYAQIKNEIASIYAFCERNDLVGTLKKASQSAAAKDIYQRAYERDLAKVQAAIGKTEEFLAAYERTVATLEVSSVEADLGSDFDASIEMLRDLRDELPLYSLEDRI